MTVRRLIGATAASGLLVGAALLSAGGVAVASTADTTTLSATGSGAEEIPAGSGEEGASTTGSFQLTDAGAMTYTVTVTGNGETVSAGHIHRGETGVNGDVVVALDEAAINAGTSATVQIDAALAAEIIATPGDFYLNTHSASFAPPSGVARAQLAAGSAAPGSIDTGTGGQAAQQGASTTWLISGGVALAALGAVVVSRRRGTDTV